MFGGGFVLCLYSDDDQFSFHDEEFVFEIPDFESLTDLRLKAWKSLIAKTQIDGLEFWKARI